MKSFPKEIATLKRNQQVSPKIRLASLSPFLDGHEIVRVGGRIERADIPFSSRHPILLSPDNAKLGHEGVEHKVKTKFGLLRRPVSKLALLEECSPN